ncbi:transposase [Stigmatella aurantiaca DW4/3-1]|uniref:Transposase n=1 Tax=Stigmatella aurantiaca (strain DW4/3-1) TaxID=378806 RepID=E3FFI9_STIAD|nr:transposase [Stigmatella aurantiaca DW4/3-1]
MERYRREVTSIVVLTAPLRPGERPHLVARHIEGSVHGSDVVAFLRYLYRRLGGRPVWLVWNWLQAYRAADVKRFLQQHLQDFRVHFLPSYSPDLNPEEQCNASVKKALLNALPENIEELRRQARREFRRLQHCPATLRAYFAHAGLSLNSTSCSSLGRRPPGSSREWRELPEGLRGPRRDRRR